MVIDLQAQIPVRIRTSGDQQNGRRPTAGPSSSQQTGRDHRQAAASPASTMLKPAIRTSAWIAGIT